MSPGEDRRVAATLAGSAPDPLLAWPARHPGRALGLALALAFVVRAVRWQVTAVMFNDGPIFLAIAQAMAAGDWSTALGHPFHPLYSLAVAAVHGLGAGWETSAVVVSVVTGTAAVGALYGFVRAAFGPTEAAIAAWLLAVHPAAIEYTGDIQSEGLYLALFLAAAWALWVGLRDRRAGPALLGGALSGAAYLTRPEGLGIAVVAGGIAALRLVRGRFAVRAALVWGLALAVGVLALAGPYLVWLRIEEGHWTFSGKKSLEVVAGLEEAPREGPDPLAPAPLPEPGPEGPPAAGERSQADSAPASGGAPSADASVPEEARPPPASRPAQILAALGDVLRTHRRALRYELLPLLLAGWLLAGRPRPGERGAFVLGAVGFHFLVLFGLAANVGYVSGRHAFPPLTLAFGHAALGLRLLAGFLGGPSPRRRSAMAALLLLVVTGIGLGKALRPDRLDGLAERRAAEWLAAQPVEVDAVAARKRRTAYYADAPWVKLASAAFPAGLRELGASHLILTDEDRPEYAKLGPLEPPEARLLHSVGAGGQTAFIYDLEPWRRPASQTP